MATELKHFFSKKTIRTLANDVHAVHPSFDFEGFAKQASQGLSDKALLDRARHISVCLHNHLPPKFPQAWKVLQRSLGPEHVSDELLGVGMAPFYYLPHVMFVAAYGRDDFDVAMKAQYELTKRFSAEFSIRYFIDQDPQKVWTYLNTWVNDPNPHVRRLVSEGTRCRLPWAVRVPWLDAHLDEVVVLLEKLKHDPSSMVRRSVANNLNDIGKLNLQLLTETCARWMLQPSANMRALVKHGLRSAVKKGHTPALAVLGFGETPRVRVKQSKATPARVRIGGHVVLSCVVENTLPRPQPVLVDVRVWFVKASGKVSAKVFKVKECVLKEKETLLLECKVSLAVHTTRKPYPGPHKAEWMVNGVVMETCDWQVV